MIASLSCCSLKVCEGTGEDGRCEGTREDGRGVRGPERMGGVSGDQRGWEVC